MAGSRKCPECTAYLESVGFAWHCPECHEYFTGAELPDPPMRRRRDREYDDE